MNLPQLPKGKGPWVFSDGILLVDKPNNLQSSEVSAFFSKLFSVKAGHAGTLDPNVSGLLPVALGRATKLLRFLFHKDKRYIAVMERPYINKEEMIRLMKKFEGPVIQVPPKQSAVAKRPRKRVIYSLKLLDFLNLGDRVRVMFEARVQAGTYIRVLCQDLGGKMIDLRRINVGEFSVSQAVPMQRIRDEYLSFKKCGKKDIFSHVLSPEEVVLISDVDKVEVTKEGARRACHGASLYSNHILKGRFREGEWVALFYKGRFFGFSKALKSGDRVKNTKPILKPVRIHYLV